MHLRLQSAWRRWDHLHPQERGLLLQNVVALPMVALALHVVGFNRVYHWMAQWSSPHFGKSVHPTDEQIQSWRAIAKIVERRAPFRGNCLSRSLTFWWLARQHGWDCGLRIGTRHHNGEFQAHAWVELDGQPLNESLSVYRRFTAFDQPLIPGNARWL